MRENKSFGRTRVDQSGVSTDSVRLFLEAQTAYLAGEIKHTESLIRGHIDKHHDLKEQSDLLDSIPGIARTTVARLLAEIPDFKQIPKCQTSCRPRRNRPVRTPFR